MYCLASGLKEPRDRGVIVVVAIINRVASPSEVTTPLPQGGQPTSHRDKSKLCGCGGG